MLRGEQHPLVGGDVILRQASAIRIELAKVALAIADTLIGCHSEVLCSLRVVGRTPSEKGCNTGCWGGGYLVLQRTTNGVGRVPVELTGRSSVPVVLGRIVTALSAAALLALCSAAAVRRRQRHEAARR